MSALTFLGGLANEYNAVRTGMDEEQARKEHAEDRAYQREQRDLQRRQQQRVLGEQAREDAKRSILSDGPAPGDEVEADAPPDLLAPPPVAPGPQQIEAAAQPGANPLPAPAAPVRERRPLTQDAWLRSKADRMAANGFIDESLKYREQADQIGMQRSAMQFQQIKANSAGKDPVAIANEVASVYNRDPMHGQITKIGPSASGTGVSITARNKLTGTEMTREYETPKALLDSLEAYYSPKTYADYAQGVRDAASKAQAKMDEERAKGHVVAPGAAFVPGAGDTRQPFVNNNGMVWSGSYNPDGSPEMVRPGRGGAGGAGGAGGGSGKGAGKVPDAAADVDKIFKGMLEHTALKDAAPAAVARAQTLARQFAAETGQDATVAVEAAINAATDPTKVKTKFDPKTGQIVDAYEYQGDNFIVERRGTPQNARGVAPEQMAALANGYLAGLPEADRKQMATAAVNGEARAALNKSVEDQLRSPKGLAALESRLGRKPTDEDLAAATKAAIDKLAAPLDMIGMHADRQALGALLKSSGYSVVDGKVVKAPPADKPAANGGPRLRQVGGLTQPMSLQERQQAARDLASKQAAEKAESDKRAPGEAAAKAEQLLAAGDLPSLAKLQSSNEFGLLDKQTQMRIYRAVNGLQ